MVTYPKEWDVVALGTKCEITSSKRVFESEWSKHGIPFLRTRDIASFHAGEEQKDKLYISEETYREKTAVSGEPHKGDLLVTGVGTIGLPYLVPSDDKMYFKDGNILWVKKSDDFVPEYLYLQFLSKEIIEQIRGGSGFTTVGTFTIKSAKKLMMPMPKTKEQKGIADTLEVFDTHIANLSELIEKKKAVRDGALEDLVSGRTRLAGFMDSWIEVPFSKVIVPKARIGWQGLRSDEYLRKGYSYLIGGTDFYNGTISLNDIWFVAEERYQMDSNIQVSSGDVLVTKDGTIGKVAMVPTLDKPATLNSGVYVFRTKNGLERGFLYRILQSTVFRKFIDTLAAGSTIMHLYQKDLKKFVFMMPKDTEEQKAIANTLSSMDDEITALEDERNKMIQIRDGAMDALLTGRVRLSI